MNRSKNPFKALNWLAENMVKPFASCFRRSRFSAPLSDEVKSVLEKAVHAKDNRRYREALNMVDGVLKVDPDNPVATYIKAAILWEGFGDSYTAKLGIQRVKQLVPSKNAKLNQMASELIETIERSRNAKS